MSLRNSRSRSAVFGLAALLASSRAYAQACCAGGSAVTPARLELHEDALVGAQLRAGNVFGSYEPSGHYLGSPSGDGELDLEEDFFAAVRVVGRGQVALLVPLLETRRSTPFDGAHFGGGVGDVNATLRYDVVAAGESRYVPGIALLAGVTLPTGTAPESATAPLAVDATGIGAWQVNAALALEQTCGPWLLNATGIVAKRTARYGQTLGTQLTLLFAGAYTFDNDMALALSLSYALEGDASQSASRTEGGRGSVPDSSKRLTTVTLSGLVPLSDTWRLLGGVFVEPPASQFGTNQPAVSGLAFTVIRSWS